jgi:hypothetical protein
MSRSFGSALISWRVTGRFSGLTDFNSTALQSPSVAVGSGNASRVTSCNANDRFVTYAMIKEDGIALAHRAEMLSSEKIPHPGPFRAAIAHKIVPRIGFRFLFHEP